MRVTRRTACEQSQPTRYGIRQRRPMAKCFPVLTGALFLSALALPAWSAEGDIDLGLRAYQQVCAYCHNDGQVRPELRRRRRPPHFFTTIARTGLAAMPAFPETFIDEKTLLAVGEYLSKSSLPESSD